MKYLIKRKNYNMYYSREVTPEILHFVDDPDKAHVFKTEDEVNKVFDRFCNKENFEIIEKEDAKKKERKIVKGEKYARD